ncbi:MAG: hypothetical protein QOD64_1730, partial [Verrucomicrobiota bacterium]
TGLMAKVLIPGENKLLAVLRNERVQFPQLRASETARFCQRYGLQPELGVSLRLLDMDMTRFNSFAAKKEEPKTGDSDDLWHAWGAERSD